MATKKRALGRGLDALLGMGAEQAAPEERNGDQLKSIPIDLIERGRYQPRVDMKSESLADLANSIKAQGVIQPITIRAIDGPNRFEIVAGERRWRAAQMAGLHEIPAIVKDMSDEVSASVALIENIQREDLNPMEEAEGLHRLVHEFGLTHEDVAEAVGRSRASVSNLLRLLVLHGEVKKLLETGELEMGHGRALAGLEMAQQAEAARKVVAGAMSVRQTERLVKSMRETGTAQTKVVKNENPDVKKLEESISQRLGASVKIKQGRGGKGSIAINYNSLDELDGILEHIR